MIIYIISHISAGCKRMEQAGHSSLRGANFYLFGCEEALNNYFALGAKICRFGLKLKKYSRQNMII